ncbi:hypothetical protein Bca52824_051881 [Brassica carinata]|uniref:KIB1-4 beta-propeller domain-containing protein n=2 Tax=Brassica TaxID=3705 RepID=A0A8X7R2K4_BRACI|nr:hypothetical protein Bca52824_051881 [Brassica carinata]VDD21705.1 unnamed protein product [Brassica oleracea]
MSMLLRRLSSLGLGKPHVSMRSSLLLHSRGFSTSLLQTPPCRIVLAEPCGGDLGKLVVMNLNKLECKDLEKKVPLELVDDEDSKIIIGASGGWIATLKEDGVLRLQDDFNPVASDTNPKRIPLPPLVTLPHCQTKIITNVSVSSSSPEDDEDCVVAIKFLGPQLSFCKPAGKSGKPEWTNIKIENPCFYSSRVMFSKKDNMFRIPGSGGHLIGSWDPYKPSNNPTFQRLRFKNMPKLTKAKQNLMDLCCRSEHLVESRPTGETFLVKQYKKTIKITKVGIARMRTKALMVFKLDNEGNAVYTQEIGDLVTFLSMSEPFCVPATSFPGLYPNSVKFHDFDESGFVGLKSTRVWSRSYTCSAPYYIPPQNIIES